MVAELSRKNERRLLLAGACYLIIGAVVLYLWLGSNLNTLICGVAIPILGFGLISLCLSLKKCPADLFLLPIVSMLIYTGLIMLYRLNTAYAQKQFIWLGIGLICMIASILWLNNYKKLANYKYLLAVVGAIALFLPIFIGMEQGGAKSWLNLKLFTLQPSEFVKIILVLFLASFLAENKFVLNRKIMVLQVWGPLMTMWGIGIILLVCQKDLGTALIYFGTFLTMLYMASSRIIYVLSGLILFAGGAVMAGLIFDHVAIRYTTWMNPWNYPQAEGYQILQSLYALGSGGMAGSGLGGGHPSLIPAVHTDFIFSALTEETGLLGAVGVLILYLCLIYRGFTIALQARDDFSSLLAGGLTALLGLQIFIITAGVIKLFPLTGVPLPYISYGGSSLVANLIIVGMLLNISAQNSAQSKEKLSTTHPLK